MGNKNGRKHLKKCSLFLAISEGKLKLSLDFILHLSKCRRSIAQVTANSDKNVDKGKYSSVSSRSANLHSTMEIRVAITWKDGNGSTSECRYITLGYTQRKFHNKKHLVKHVRRGCIQQLIGADAVTHNKH